MQIKYDAKPKMITTPDKHQIQVIWLPASSHYRKNHEVEIVASKTMIICNPNLGFAEAQQYTSEWPEFYLDYGINVVLWNYRGYGKSTGSPTPTRLRQDAMLVC